MAIDTPHTEDESYPKPPKMLSRILDELGLINLHRSTLDVKLLCIQRFVRLFAYGGSTLILVSFLSTLHIPDAQIGLFMTLTLIGDVLISLALTLVADSLGRRAILAMGAALMAVSGVVFGLVRNYWILLLAAVLGVISPSGNEIGPFRAIEESTLAHLTPANARGDVFAWYTLIGAAGTATGIMCSGWVVHSLEAQHGWESLRIYRVVFFGYAAIGAVKFALACALSKAVEAEKKRPAPVEAEEEPLLSGDAAAQATVKKEAKSSWTSMLPDISPESRLIVLKLCMLFAVDNFASGLAPLAWMVNFFQRKFHLEEGKLGSLFFVTSIIAAASTLVASSLAKRIGNVKTMAFTHLPSAICLALLPIPSSAPLAMTLLILRSCTQSMDTAPRSAFMSAAVLPSERTAVIGLINVLKTAFQSLGLLGTGLLADRNMFWIAFVIAGSLKACYDIGMLVMFSGLKPRQEPAEARSQGNEAERSEPATRA